MQTGPNDMIFLWLIASAALVAALLAWRHARNTARRLEQLSQMYWELKYQHGELRVQLQRLTSPAAAGAGTPQDAGSADAPATRPKDGFIPLSSLKR
jgi:hypothetical protein